ncbi:unnamed protein product [Musa hybrid cultivar]
MTLLCKLFSAQFDLVDHASSLEVVKCIKISLENRNSCGIISALPLTTIFLQFCKPGNFNGILPSTTLIHVELPFISCFHIEIKSTQLDYNLCKLVFGNLFESLQVLIGAQDAIITLWF